MRSSGSADGRPVHGRRAHPSLRPLAATAAIAVLVAAAAVAVAHAAAPLPGTLDYVLRATPAAVATHRTTWWCGDAEASLDRPDLTSAPTIHVLYAIPADGEDRFAQLAPLLSADIEAVDSWWRAQDPTRAPRWDLAASTTCPTGVQLDLGMIRLPGTSETYLDSETISALSHDVLAFVAPTEKTVILYDGPRSEPSICGTSSIAALYPGALGASFTWGHSDCAADLGSGGLAAASIVHELVHDLGAVPLEGPANRCQDSSHVGHVCDDPGDLMYPFAARLLPQLALDVHRDDYYAHAGAWWDVADSRWLIHLPLRRLTVTITPAGGRGTVTSATGSLTCEGICALTVEDGASLTLRAAAAAGSRLYGWEGACTGLATSCVVTVGGDVGVAARFGPSAFRVSLSVTGAGRVSGLGATCGRACGSWALPGRSLTLVARPAAGYAFRRWVGKPCAGRPARCRFTPAADTRLTAVFTRSR